MCTSHTTSLHAERFQQLALMLWMCTDANMYIDHARDHVINHERACSSTINMWLHTDTNMPIEYTHGYWAGKDMGVPRNTRQYLSDFVLLLLEDVVILQGLIVLIVVSTRTCISHKNVDPRWSSPATCTDAVNGHGHDHVYRLWARTCHQPPTNMFTEYRHVYRIQTFPLS